MAELSIDTSTPVLVTGATGYVAGWVIRDLLAAGVTVHGTVRDPDNAEKVGPLTEMAADLPGELKLFAADLLQAEGFDAAMAGCSIVFHTASPYTVQVENPQRDLIDPALNGTRNVLEAANRTESVTRVVLTSSGAAIFGDTGDCADAPGGVLNEDVWNTSSSLEINPYSYSKMIAERAAWEIAGAQDRWRLVVVNPTGIWGPSVTDNIPTSESFRIVKMIADGSVKSGIPAMEFGGLDVRDVADAHLAAAYLPDAEGRHLLFEKSVSLMDMGKAIAAVDAGAAVPRMVLPKWLVWLIGPLVDSRMTRRSVSRGVGHTWVGDNSKSIEKLGLTYRPVEKALQEMYVQMKANGAFA